MKSATSECLLVQTKNPQRKAWQVTDGRSEGNGQKGQMDAQEKTVDEHYCR